jgi:FSR family fosmidomycin resistance protein-like MFS transporter
MKMNKKALAILSVGHLITDVNQGALPALLPFFRDAMNLSYTAAGVIYLFGNLTSSVIQPAFGYLSDRRPAGWLLPLAPMIAGLGYALSGIAPSYPLLLLCIIIGGIGIASYHPEGFKAAHFFTGEKRATGMSIFSVGGNFGIALGPLWALTLVSSFGLRGTLGMIVPGIILGGMLFSSSTWLISPMRTALSDTRREKRPYEREGLISLAFLIGVVIIRTWIQAGLVSYIPFYYIDHLKGSPLYAGKLISTFLLAGAVGTVVGAPVADFCGHKRFLTVTTLLMFPMLILFYNSSGLLAFVILGVAGMLLISTVSVTMVMAQSLLPHHLGMASGLMAGFAIGTGGIGVTLLGAIADHWGVPLALKSISVLPLIGVGLCLLVRYPTKRKNEG